MSHDIFISYSQQDRVIAEGACAALEAKGVKCWIAPRDIPPGAGYAKALINAIVGSRLFLLVLSANSNNSRQVLAELERAFSKDIPILPFRIQDVALGEEMEYFVSGSQWFDALKPPLEGHLERLTETVQRLLNARHGLETEAVVAVPSTKDRSAPNNLPTQTTSLVGREQEIAAVTERLRDPAVRLLTLVGPGGIGKTRLGLESAGRLLADFRDGVFFVPLAPLRDPELVVSTMAQTLAIRQMGLKTAFAMLKDYLREKELLLLLDNFEQVVSAAPELSDLLAASPGLKLLVTSREALRLSGEHRFPVPPLALPDPQGRQPVADLSRSEAVRLFVARARAVKPDFVLNPENAAAVVEICCRRLEGLPLAIELAAARLAVLTPQEILGRMEHRLKVLTGGPRDLPERQQTMRNTIAWSYDLLAQAEQKLFCRLSVFAGGCTLEAAEAVGDVDGDLGIEVLEGLESLVAKSLLQRESANEETRFVMLETVREYGQERLAETNEASAARQQHAAFFLELAVKALPEFSGPRDVEWLDRLERDHDNLRVALSGAQKREESDLALRLCTALGMFWNLRGHYAEGRVWFERVLAVGSGVDPALRAHGLNAAASMEFRWGNPIACRRLSEQALSAGREMLAAGTNSIEVCQHIVKNALFDLSSLFVFLGDWIAGQAFAEECLSLCRELGDRSAIANALWARASMAIGLGDFSLAGSLLDEGMTIAREIASKDIISVQIYGRACLALHQGDFKAARSLFEEDVAIDREIGNRRGVAFGLGNAAFAAYEQGDYVAARAAAKESLQIAQEVGQNNYFYPSLRLFAALAVAQGEAERGARLLSYSDALMESNGVSLSVMTVAGYLKDRVDARVRASLSETAFAAAWEEGRAMSLDQAIEYALAEEPVAGPEVAPPEAASRVDASPLTRREREIAALIAQGLANREIAAQLVISERTVETHLTNIMGKLDFNSRSQVAVWAAKHLG